MGWSDDGPIPVEHVRLVFIRGGGACGWPGLDEVVVRDGIPGSARLASVDELAQGAVAGADDDDRPAGLVADFDERLPISTGVGDRGSGGSGLLALAVSREAAAGCDDAGADSMVDMVAIREPVVVDPGQTAVSAAGGPSE